MVDTLKQMRVPMLIAAFGLLSAVGVAEAAVSLPVAKRIAAVTRAYDYPETSWGAWLKPRLRYLARQCTQLAVRELPSDELDKSLALLEAGMPMDDVLWVTEAEKSSFDVPEGYQTPINLGQVCETLATHKVRPECWATLSGSKSPYEIGLSCALTTTGTLDQGIQRWAVQAIEAPADWFASRIPSAKTLALKEGEVAQIKLTVPQVAGSGWLSPPQAVPVQALQFERPAPIEERRIRPTKVKVPAAQREKVTAVPASAPLSPPPPPTAVALPLPVIPGTGTAMAPVKGAPAVEAPAPLPTTTVSRPPAPKKASPDSGEASK